MTVEEAEETVARLLRDHDGSAAFVIRVSDEEREPLMQAFERQNARVSVSDGQYLRVTTIP